MKQCTESYWRLSKLLEPTAASRHSNLLSYYIVGHVDSHHSCRPYSCRPYSQCVNRDRRRTRDTVSRNLGLYTADLSKPTRRTARVVMPEPPVESDEEVEEDEENVDGDDGDILADLPDDTEVRHNIPCPSKSPSLIHINTTPVV
jgi:hypothetical protein